VDEQGITQTKLNTMEETYIVAWTVRPHRLKSGNQSSFHQDYWERCETLEEAQELYNKVMEELDPLKEDQKIYTASIAKEIQSTES